MLPCAAPWDRAHCRKERRRQNNHVQDQKRSTWTTRNALRFAHPSDVNRGQRQFRGVATPFTQKESPPRDYSRAPTPSRITQVSASVGPRRKNKNPSTNECVNASCGLRRVVPQYINQCLGTSFCCHQCNPSATYATNRWLETIVSGGLGFPCPKVEN